MLNIIFIVNENFTVERESVGVNEKVNCESFKEKSDKEKREFSDNQTLEIFLNQRVKNLQQKEEISQGKD